MIPNTLKRSVHITHLPGDAIWALNYYWLQHLPMQMCRPQWLSSAFGDEREGVDQTPPDARQLTREGFKVQTALISSYGRLNVRAVLTRTTEIEERDIHGRSVLTHLCLNLWFLLLRQIRVEHFCQFALEFLWWNGSGQRMMRLLLMSYWS